VAKTEFLLAWACLAAIAVPADMYLMWRRLTGRMGEPARAGFQASVTRLGGVRTAVLLAVCLDVILPPVALAACLVAAARARKPGVPGTPGPSPRGGTSATGAGTAAPAGQPAARGSAGDPLARLLSQLGMPFERPWRATATELAGYAAAAGAGTVLRLLVPLPVLAAAGIGAAVIAAGLLPRAGGTRRAGPQLAAPDWAVVAEAADQALPAGALREERRQLVDFAARTRRRRACLYLYRCQGGSRQYRGLCQSALIHEEGGYLLAVLGEHLQPVAAAVLGHELSHRSGWRQRLARAATLARLTGWLLAGWAAGWPWLLAAAAAIQAVTMLAFCIIEAGCDLHAAREHGAAALIKAVRSGASPHGSMPGWERHLFHGLRHVTELTRHPPAAARCLILRVLASPAREARITSGPRTATAIPRHAGEQETARQEGTNR
jgi:hypothetical protein